MDSKTEKGGHRIFYFAMNILDAHTLSQKQDTVSKSSSVQQS